MHFDASLKRLQNAVKNLEKASKSAAKKKSSISSAQIDMFSAPAPACTNASNDIDVKALKHQLDEEISSVETILKESA
jgi:hypothetical protein